MSPKYADIIIDISHEAIDRTFQYKVPKRLCEQVRIGTQVSIPFGRGNHLRSGYVVSFSQKSLLDENMIKEIADVREGTVDMEGSLIELAAYIKEQYGSTMINALKTVMPIKEKVKGLVRKEVRLLVSKEEASKKLSLYQKKNAKAKVRLLTELMDTSVIPYNLVTGKLNISASTLTALKKERVIAVEEEGYYRDVLENEKIPEDGFPRQDFVYPNTQQQAVIDRVTADFNKGVTDTYLLKGVTGSGKTLVYIEIIDRLVKQGKEAIVLIPEIALTYQTVKRFRQRFGSRVTIMNSRLSKGERYDQFEKAKNGEVSVIIGPRSALFTPFRNLGLIVIDEEHEASYKSEYPPKYHAREVAIKRAQMAKASVLLGSATPSVESYYHAVNGDYTLLTLDKRANENAALAKVSVVDLRQELKNGNRSIFSNRLKELMRERLLKKEQIMLFINRRGFAGFISCRSCGHVIKCPHCDVSLTEHYKGTVKEKLVCHYCGYEQKRPSNCPECGSPYIAGFGIGTQKVEEMVYKEFPEAKVLRMDMDTTRNKNAHEEILSRFANGEADVLVGTQMIVKGHDFSNVTLVGVIAADLTLFDNDYKSAERTFDLLTQAAGRAGRGSLLGEVVIQTYDPEHYCIEAAAKQDYEAFYREEKAYRSLLKYPPFCHVLSVFMEYDQYEELVRLTGIFVERLGEIICQKQIITVGPADATIVKISDRYRRVVYFKHVQYNTLVELKNVAEQVIEKDAVFKDCFITFDFNPVHGY
ncbi:MAG: primosomal protein N' [Lachnospiraceae bacterium]|nr:primosomal protein N' [Lachnospiraceae bacterium]